MYKQVIVVRKDLKLTRGKLAVQVAHASLEAFKKAGDSVKRRWALEGAKKVVLKANDLNHLMFIYRKARDKNLACSIIKDAGLTEVLPGTITAVGIGPSEEKEIDKITGELKML
jgi:PTH2 family peptidyl-tRNA hydrolase